MAQARNQMLEEVAKCCLHQGNYHFAAKKFTQAGNKVEAMRALLKSGDTPKIILFTNTARNKDIYRMAGNYLQTLSWHDDMDLMRSIESFYVKGNALESLSAFYKACADVEIDEYKDYEKGLNAYVEALNTINKKIAKDGGTDPRALSMQEELKEHIEKIQRFIKAKSLYASDPGECLRIVSALIEEPGIEDAVRRGDLYTILILHNAKRSNFKKAYQYVEECLGRKPRIDIRQYINAQILDEICDKTEHPRITIQKAVATADDSDNEVGVDFSHAMRRRMNSADNQSDEEGF
uniref:Uncharacterized protein n=1 Tax=Panagrolaimus superbus TaxID=310955 RepID=A0A914YQ40_9BILA